MRLGEQTEAQRSRGDPEELGEGKGPGWNGAGVRKPKGRETGMFISPGRTLNPTPRATGGHPICTTGGKGPHDTQHAPNGPSFPVAPGQLPASDAAMSNWKKDHLGASSSEPLKVIIIGECCPGREGLP